MSRVPRYQLIYEDLASQITSGGLKPDERLPSEPLLAEQYGVSRMTVRQAVDQLQDERLLVRRRGAGTFVTHPRSRARRLNRLAPFAEEVGAEHDRMRSIIREQGSLVPPSDIAARLRLKDRQEAVRLVRLRIVDDVPAALQESWLPYALAPVVAREPLLGDSLYRTLQERCGLRLRWAEQEVSASAATAEQARILGVDEGSPLIASRRETYDDSSNPVEFVQSWARPEFPLSIRLEA
ncbi:GntR family transcriptional regulator [Actinoalloteichus hymeniacidonis]|uniref:Transcriptional regulator n=1 Tax=Actinoalloteichus hymeniacidonis TaxID=340345 RepID=A0AAC9HQD3_9PSEU|nr:GntR family transcriptional regulator [Actinoalloteichus hymeniacidonis]AOS63398.1 transcriptional regulator [Actinoalloteichus hymeniacidonis]MBB5908561.1 GntR family transcriptional regulator [Actinoalloteichus hymeniacidonis]